MRWFTLWISLCALVALPHAADAAFVFRTQSTATLAIASPLFGAEPVRLSASGPQVFTIDPISGFANVTSAFRGTDLPDPLNPSRFLPYFLANTVTAGTVVTNTNGSFNVNYQLLFELTITGGPLTGITFETLQNSTFAAANIPRIPFPVGTSFFDPTGPDTRPIFLKSDPNSILAGLGIRPGDPVGTSSNRLVTLNALVVPEPSSLAALSIGTSALGFFRLSRFRRTPKAAGK